MNAPNPQHEFLTQRYQQLWDDSFENVRRGEVIIDPLLVRRESDQRRCLTVLARPSPAIQENATALLDELRWVDPGQYCYDASEMHVTVLSLFTAIVDYPRLLVQFDRYVEAVNAALCHARPFEISFTGITLSREAIMIRGFPDSTILNDLREALRRELRVRNLTEGLDGRYLLQTAHLTVVRFRAPLVDSQRFTRVIEKYRTHYFGRTEVKELHLVRNDWYMSRQSVEVLRQFPLGQS